MRKYDTIRVFDERTDNIIAEGKIIDVERRANVIHICLDTGYRITIVSPTLEYEDTK